MKFTITKVKEGVEIEFATNTASKPVKVVLDKMQVKALVGLCETAIEANTFTFSLDL